MSLTLCPNCRLPVNTSAVSCPLCTAPMAAAVVVNHRVPLAAAVALVATVAVIATRAR
jgi:predicted amidophosphoribosyltransferase